MGNRDLKRFKNLRRMEQNKCKAKPFIKWAGGKGQLLDQLDALMPEDFDTWQDVTYIEPFVGGGAMLFHLLQTRPNIRRAVINDINPKLTTCYRIIRDNPQQLITCLKAIENYYLGLKTEEERKAYYLQQRDAFNGKHFMLETFRKTRPDSLTSQRLPGINDAKISNNLLIGKSFGKNLWNI